MARNAAILAIIGLLMAGPATGTENHATDKDALTVEHAEIVLSSEPDRPVAGYLAIWNGTGRRANLVAIESQDYGAIVIHRMESAAGVMRKRNVTEGLSIPGDAELLMRPDGVHLMLSQPAQELSAGAVTALTLIFEGDARIAAKAIMLAPGSSVVDHRHGSSDRP